MWSSGTGTRIFVLCRRLGGLLGYLRNWKPPARGEKFLFVPVYSLFRQKGHPWQQNRISFHSFTYHISSKAPEWMLPSVTSMGPDMVHSLHAGFMVASVAYVCMLDTAALKYEIGLVKFNSRSSVTGPAQIPGRAHLESRNGIAWVWVCSINGNDQNRMAWYSIQGWTRSRAYIGIPSTQSDLAGGCLALDMRRRISEASFWMNEAKLCVIHMCTVYDINIIYI